MAGVYFGDLASGVIPRSLLPLNYHFRHAQINFVHNQDMAKTPRKPSEKNPEPRKHLVVDEDAFTGVIRNLVNSPPANAGIRRKKNPETDPRKIRLFNLDGKRGK